MVDWYNAEKFAELAELHNQLTVYVTGDVGDKTACHAQPPHWTTQADSTQHRLAQNAHRRQQLP